MYNFLLDENIFFLRRGMGEFEVVGSNFLNEVYKQDSLRIVEVSKQGVFSSCLMKFVQF